MNSFPQLTRSTLWGEFGWVEAIILGGNFMVKMQFSGENFPRGQFSLGAIILGGNFFSGAIVVEPVPLKALFVLSIFKFFFSFLII